MPSFTFAHFRLHAFDFANEITLMIPQKAQMARDGRPVSFALCYRPSRWWFGQACF
jgi:hypothetical protein